MDRININEELFDECSRSFINQEVDINDHYVRTIREFRPLDTKSIYLDYYIEELTKENFDKLKEKAHEDLALLDPTLSYHFYYMTREAETKGFWKPKRIYLIQLGFWTYPLSN